MMMSRKVPRAVAAAVAFAGILLCAPLPSWSSGVYDPVPLRDREHENLIEKSRELHRYFERHALLHTDPAVLELVRELGYALAPAPTDDYIDYRFFVLRDPSPNAFALPTGDIYVHTGMLARLEDESQLAALLAHEITHVAGHHSVVSYRTSNRRIVTGLVLSGVFGDLGGLIATGLYTSLYGFSRELEQEADDRAAEMLAASVFDAHALPELFEQLARDPEGLRPRVPTVWSTHPQLESRAERSREQTASMPARGRDARAYDAVMLDVRLATLRDYIRDDYPRTAIALAESSAARHPESAQLMHLLGDAWQTLGPRSELDLEDVSEAQKRRNVSTRARRTRQERERALLETDTGQAAYLDNISRARDAYRHALALDDGYGPAYRGLGDASYGLGEHRDAARAYVEYLTHAPDAADRPVVLARLRELRDLLQAQESEQ